ncbi:glycosyltransferase family 1 protein [Bacillus clarus]|uniref:Glycosyl transferases group 1 family protein n=1 Tax=Bacillus clarus TaxID=2338372 RepID=A0A090YUT7_9BACI|nr:glycosyltransferase family 4 protein [Bacillus clarus]KFN02027.1 glycosyl transferases group 1 family protein [Bacillus clarus]RFT66469.1 glycosyltransferase family 1 protein [Bacillus clarus]
MSKKEDFPYPYIMEAMDEYFGVHSPLLKRKHLLKAEAGKVCLNLQKKKKLSILIATFWDYPHMGGLSNYIKTLSEGLKQLGHQVDIISPNQFSSSEVAVLRKEIVPEIKKVLNSRYEILNLNILKNMRNMYVYEKMLIRKIKSEEYDVFHAQDLFTANLLGRCNEEERKPLFYTPHGMYTFNRLKFGIFEKGSLEEVYYKELEKKAIEFSEQIIILSDSFREPLLQLGAKQERMKTVITGISYPKIQQKRDKLVDDKLVITCVSRLGPRKGHKVLLQALSQIESAYTDKLKVLIVGDGEMRQELERQVEDLDLHMVEFLGKRNDVPNLLAQSDLFILPTFNDSLPISIIEAMHSGLCVISTKVGGIPELVQNYETGILVGAGDVNELVDAIKFVIVYEHERKRIATNAREYAKNYLTQEVMVTQIEKIYKKVCK